MKLYEIYQQIIQESLLPPITIQQDDKYKDFYDWLMRFQQHKTTHIPPEFFSIKDEIDMVDVKKTYKLYRGIFIKTATSEHKKLKIGDTIEDKGVSWSLDPEIAVKFSRDDHGFGGGGNNWKEGKSIGIILSRVFSPSEIFCDLMYLHTKGFTKIDYPKEQEVIVFPEHKKCKIVEILNTSIRSRRQMRKTY